MTARSDIYALGPLAAALAAGETPSVTTIDSSKWFFPTSTTLLLMVAGLAVYGFYASRGGEPFLGCRILE